MKQPLPLAQFAPKRKSGHWISLLFPVIFGCASAGASHSSNNPGNTGDPAPKTSTQEFPSDPLVESTAEDESAQNAKRWPVQIYANDPWMGSPNASLSIVVFGDFTSPESQSLSQKLHLAIEHFRGTLRVVWKDLPAASHYRADIAAIYSRHAYRNLGNEGFWTVHDALFALSPDFSDPTLKDLSKQLLLKWQFVEASIELQKDGDKLYESMSLARSLQVEDAPALFINGRRIDGKIEQEALEELVIEERDYASKLIDARGSRDGLYEEMCKTQSSSSPGAGGVARSGNSSPK